MAMHCLGLMPVSPETPTALQHYNTMGYRALENWHEASLMYRV